MNDLAFCGFTLSADADDKSRWFSDDLCNQRCKVKHKSQIPFLLQCLTVCNEQTQTNTDSLSLSLSLDVSLPRKHIRLSKENLHALSLSLYLKHTLSLPLSLSHALNTKKKQEACMVGKASPAETRIKALRSILERRKNNKNCFFRTKSRGRDVGHEHREDLVRLGCCSRLLRRPLAQDLLADAILDVRSKTEAG